MNATSSRWMTDDGVIGLPRVRNWRNYKPDIDTCPESCDSECLPEHATVPNMTLSMQQILERHRRGVMLPSNGAFFDEDIPDFGKMDKFDIIDAARANAQSIKDFQDGVEKSKAQKAAKQADDAAKELARLKSIEDKLNSLGSHATDNK